MKTDIQTTKHTTNMKTTKLYKPVEINLKSLILCMQKKNIDLKL